MRDVSAEVILESERESERERERDWEGALLASALNFRQGRPQNAMLFDRTRLAVTP